MVRIVKPRCGQTSGLVRSVRACRTHGDCSKSNARSMAGVRPATEATGGAKQDGLADNKIGAVLAW